MQKWDDLAKKANPLRDLQKHRDKPMTDTPNFDPVELPAWLQKLLQERSHG